MGRDISEGIRGAMTGDGVNGISYMLYVDDLSLTTNDPGEMQVMLNRLRACAVRNGLTVNTSKSGVLSSRSCSTKFFPAYLGWYAHVYALLELHTSLSILWLLNTVLHCYPGKHGATHECGMVIREAV
eukprot:1136269-Pelagomonas_calceolata.AAC.2